MGSPSPSDRRDGEAPKRQGREERERQHRSGVGGRQRSPPAADARPQQERRRSPPASDSRQERHKHGAQQQRKRSRSPPPRRSGDDRGGRVPPRDGSRGEEGRGSGRPRSPVTEQPGRWNADKRGGDGGRSDSPDYADAGPTARRRRSPSPPRGRDWRGSGAGGGRPPSPPRGGGCDWRGGGRERDWRQGPPGPAFVPRNIRQQQSDGGGSGGRAPGPRPRSRSPRRHGDQHGAADAGPPRPAVSDDPEKAAAMVKAMMGGGPRGPAPPPPAAAPAAAAPNAGSGLSLEQKKKLLWGGKKAAAAGSSGGGGGSGAPPAPAVFGANRWDQAELGDEASKLKFLKLMGGKAAAEAALKQAPAAPPGPPAPAEQPPAEAQQLQAPPGQPVPGPQPLGPAPAPEEGAPQAAVIMKRDQQVKVLSELEREFESGLRRQLGHNRTGGLGL